MNTILIIEEDLSLRTLLKMHFKNAGYEVIGATDFSEALEKSKSKPKVIFIDLLLFDKSDSNFLYTIRHHPENFGTPKIIGILNRADGELIASYLQAQGGIDHIFRTPVELDELYNLINQLVTEKTKSVK